MNVEIKKKEKNFVDLDMTIDAKTATDEYNRACKRIAGKVNISGFRRGKAPRNIIEKHVGQETIQKEVIDALLPIMISKAVEDNDFDVISEPAIKSLTFKTGEDVKIVVELELRPEVEIGEYKNISLDVDDYQLEDDFVEKELNYVKNRFASFEPVTGRKTTENDIVVFDFEGTCNGEKIKGGSAKNYNLDLGNSNFIPGFAEQLVGHDISEEFTIDVTFPENYHDETLKGQPAQFAIKINEIKEKKVPELNDELAQKSGNYQTLDELRSDIEKYAQDLKKSENEKKALEAIFEHLLKDVKVELSDSLINREMNTMVTEMKNRLSAQGSSFEKMLAAEGVEKVMNEIREEAVKRIKSSLIIYKIAKLESIEVTADDLNNKIDRIAQQYNADRTMVMQQLFSDSKAISSIGQHAISEKVAKFLLDNSNINYVKSDK